MARNLRRFREIFHVPAERSEYYYMLREELEEPLNGVIGVVCNDTCDDLRILIEVDEDYMQAKKATHPTLYVDPENYRSESRIIMNRRMGKQLMKQNEGVVFALWHEVGHFHTMETHVEEYLNYMNTEDGGYTAEQYMALLDGKVLDYEAAADDFAVEYCGPQTAIIGINGMIAELKMKEETVHLRGLIMELLNRKRRFLAKREEG